MRISVVIPVFNGEAFIGRCVESVLEQSRPASQVLVVNDGSNDRTREILRGFESRIEVLDQDNRGQSNARNRGIHRACGDYVAFLDADDAFTKDHLKTLAAGAEVGGAEIVHSGARLPYLSEAEHATVRRRRSKDDALDHLFRFQIHIQASMVLRSFVLEQDVWFDEELEIAEDALFFWSLILNGARLEFIPGDGVMIGVHAGNTTADYLRTYRETQRAYARLDEFIERRSLMVSARARERIEAGRQHSLIFEHLLSLYLEPRPETRAHLRRLLSQRAVAPHDRVRCLVAQMWPHIPLARHPVVSRALFGYTVMRWEGTRRGGSKGPV